MRCFSIKMYFEDIGLQLRCNKRRALFCVLCAVVGIVLGVVLFNTANYNWWYCNRYDFACKLVFGGFFEIFFAFLMAAAVYSLLLIVFSLCSLTRLLCYPLLVFVSLYFSANCAAIFACVGMVGIIYVIFALAFGQIVSMLCCFLTLCQEPCRRSFREVICDLKGILLLQVVSVILRVAVIFALLRPISNLI